jgi:hypothetical protein
MDGAKSELLSIINRLKLNNTDKSTGHSYIPHVYDELFLPFKDKKTSILEIGIREGDSIRLWHEYFSNAKIYGIDNNASNRFRDVVLDRVQIIFGDAYDGKTTSTIKSKYSIVIDDGSHRIEDMKKCIQIYYPKLIKNGILILEDIQKFEWINEIEQFCNEMKITDITVFDLRNNKNRYDDIAIAIRKK